MAKRSVECKANTDFSRMAFVLKVRVRFISSRQIANSDAKLRKPHIMCGEVSIASNQFNYSDLRVKVKKLQVQPQNRLLYSEIEKNGLNCFYLENDSECIPRKIELTFRSEITYTKGYFLQVFNEIFF